MPLNFLIQMCPTEMLNTIYFSLINSHLPFSISTQICVAKSKLCSEEIKISIKKALRIMFNIEKKDTVG